MQPSTRFWLRCLMSVVAIAACALGTGIAFAVEPVTVGSGLTGWAALYGIPWVLIFGRNVPRRRAMKVAGRIALFGVFPACLYGLLGFAMSGYVGLVGGFGLAMLSIGWLSLFAAAFPELVSFVNSAFDVGLPSSE